MIIYSSPKSGKTYIANNKKRYVDGDKIFFEILEKAFNCHITDDNTKGEQIIQLFKADRTKAEECYTKYMNWLKENKHNNKFDILIGTRRFMWLADVIYIKDSGVDIIGQGESDSIRKWGLEDRLKRFKNKYLSEVL